jgi:hypothetical protein
MNRSNLVVAGAFLVLGIYLAASAAGLPAGVGGLPGPGFFPQLIGSVTILLAVSLLVQTARRREPAAFALANKKTVAGAIGLTFLYLLLWGTGWFAVKTAVFLALLLRFLGQRWGTSALVALVLTATVVGAFQYGLRITLE